MIGKASKAVSAGRWPGDEAETPDQAADAPWPLFMCRPARDESGNLPPRVEYALTPMGRTLHDTACTLLRWADDHLPEIDAARTADDRRAALLDASLNRDPAPSRQA